MDAAGARRAVRTFFWAYAALLTVSIAGWLVHWYFMGRLDAHQDSFRDLFDQMRSIDGVLTVVGYGALAGMIGSVLLLAARAGGGAGRLARWAGIGFALGLALRIGFQLLSSETSDHLVYLRVSSLVQGLLRAGSWAALWLALRRIVRDNGHTVASWLPGLLVACLVLEAAPMLLFLGDIQLDWFWPWGFVTIDLLVGWVALATLAAAQRKLGAIADGRDALPMARVIGGAPAFALAGDGWRRGAEGLGTYATALTVRLVVLGAFYSLLLFAFFGKSMTMVSLVGKTMPLADMATVLFLMAGVLRFAAIPIETGGRGLAHAAFALMLGALLIGLYGYVQQLRLLSATEAMQSGGSYSSYGSLSELMDMADRLPWIALIGIVVGLFGQLLLLLGFGAVAEHLGVTELVRSIRVTAVGLLLVSVAVVGLYWYVLTTRHASAGTVLPLGFAVVVGAIVVLIRYIGLVRWLHAAMTSALAGPPDSLIDSRARDGVDPPGSSPGA